MEGQGKITTKEESPLHRHLLPTSRIPWGIPQDEVHHLSEYTRKNLGSYTDSSLGELKGEWLKLWIVITPIICKKISARTHRNYSDAVTLKIY